MRARTTLMGMTRSRAANRRREALRQAGKRVSGKRPGYTSSFESGSIAPLFIHRIYAPDCLSKGRARRSQVGGYDITGMLDELTAFLDRAQVLALTPWICTVLRSSPL